jgi:hypothetical protein
MIEYKHKNAQLSLQYLQETLRQAGRPTDAIRLDGIVVNEAAVAKVTMEIVAALRGNCPRVMSAKSLVISRLQEC